MASRCGLVCFEEWKALVYLVVQSSTRAMYLAKRTPMVGYSWALPSRKHGRASFEAVFGSDACFGFSHCKSCSCLCIRNLFHRQGSGLVAGGTALVGVSLSPAIWPLSWPALGGGRTICQTKAQALPAECFDWGDWSG